MISTISNLPLVGQLHFLVGVICLVAGGAAFLARKGRLPHRLAGRVFVVCMLLLCASGLYMSLSRSILFTAFLALLAGHAVTTGWMAAARIAGRAERLAAGVISLVAMAAVGSGLVVASLPSGTLNDLPPVAFYSLGGVAFWIAGIDVFALRRGPANDRQRLTRHVWRMGFALFIASFIFFFGNNSVLPPVLRTPLALLAPVLTVTGLTVYASIRTRFGRQTSAGTGEGSASITA
ncbi:hypothetical protein [Maricaulis sp.]|uniref:hypothetical protein n=1 Tax=Maricaulis sp. TaxID=1486257 RepID=UPI002B27B6BB|nr:hypothetical protein [Maricaulis sp.]